MVFVLVASVAWWCFIIFASLVELLVLFIAAKVERQLRGVSLVLYVFTWKHDPEKVLGIHERAGEILQDLMSSLLGIQTRVSIRT